MATEKTDVSSMELDDQITTDPKFSINVLQLLKSAQMQHGLRFGDYTRYRRYCTARLRRLYKSLKFTHGRGKYAKKSVTASTVTEVRFLHLVLYTAERAWSHAMEKRQLPDGPNARQRSYLIGRLRKAVKWATLFAELCAIKGDSRTSLEAEAYASFMKGNLLFEQDQNWDVALKSFKSARQAILFTKRVFFSFSFFFSYGWVVYEELGKYGDLDNQVLCRERVEELEPSIRYCLHKIGESNLQASELVHIGEIEGPALDLFKAKLEAVMTEARTQQAASMTEFHWLGHRFPISNAKTRVSILKAQELEKELNDRMEGALPAEKRLAVFDKIFAAYNEARGSIRSDLATAGSSENIKDDLSGLDKAIGAVLLQRTIERNQLLVSIAKSKLSKAQNEKVTKPEELVRLFDLLLQNTSDLSDLLSSGRDRKEEEVALIEECEIKELIFRAERCFFLAKSYSSAGKRTEAYSLFSFARSLAENALKKLRSATSRDQVTIKELETLHNNCRSNSCIEHAMGIMEHEKAPEDLSKKISTVSISGTDRKVSIRKKHNLTTKQLLHIVKYCIMPT
ncbi:putative signal recognition particle subunit SRP68, SRP68 domain superfamily [Helianthus annuus]|uniref:Signal recognition particle subunit SRP68 n=1 Tax=Helianthus annuus TaxID=4232 RepID=A0A9K3I9Z7_HELAN|nr:putative signal recognition particle subunit SRP68, SRP68 domain superfamily [Helianthus annuus]KAJ0895310.1 putative signal recognition particle subunit SRP68, SRP68 domain superfamily [Helianthus annuus]